MARVRLLHLSDLHLAGRFRSRFVAGRFHSRYDDSVLNRVAEFAFNRQHSLDGILISGDLAQSGLPEDLGLAADFVYLPPSHSTPNWMTYGSKRAWPTLQASAKRIALVPGNHDRFHSPIRGRPGNGNFDGFFGRHWKAGVGGVQKYLFPDEEDPQLAVLCADFSLARNEDATVQFGHWGQGRVDPTRLLKLVEETQKVKDGNRSAIVWMVHCAPEFEDVEDLPELPENLRLIDGADLVREAHRLGVRHVLCGHTHISTREYKSPTQPSVRINCVGSSTLLSKNKERPSMRILEFRTEGPSILGMYYQDWVWDRKDRTFRRMSANSAQR